MPAGQRKKYVFLLRFNKIFLMLCLKNLSSFLLSSAFHHDNPLILIIKVQTVNS